MNIDELTLGQVKELKGMFCGGKEVSGEKSLGTRIVILQRGWVAVGKMFQKGSDCRLEDAAIIRVWGTTKGLSEIAANGPTKNTILDKSPTIRFHELTVVATMDCEEKKWNL